MPSVTDWLMVVITFVYVVATIFICIANLRSAKATREQLIETKRQYDEENRAYITYAIIYEKRTVYGLRFTNHGKRVAKEVTIEFKDEFIHSLTERQFIGFLEQTSKNTCVLGVNQSIDIYLGGNAFRDNKNKLPIEGNIIYSDDIGEYKEHFLIDFNSYPPIFSVDSETEDMRQEIKRQTQELEKIRRELYMIRQGNIQEKNHA